MFYVGIIHLQVQIVFKLTNYCLIIFKIFKLDCYVRISFGKHTDKHGALKLAGRVIKIRMIKYIEIVRFYAYTIQILFQEIAFTCINISAFCSFSSDAIILLINCTFTKT